MFVGAILRSPFCAAESIRVERRLKNATLDPPPVFIIGHWRSGTTLLHNLMSRDPAFCFPTITDALRPYDFFPSPFEPISRAILTRALPATRPMDDLPLQAGLPQEDEIALAAMGAPSLFNCFYFPTGMSRVFAREVLLEGLTDAQASRWRRSLRYYLCKLALLSRGRRLLIKNPAHGARVAELRKLFPGAKFIHIHRDPLEVIASTRKLYRALLPLLALQDYDLAEVEEHIAWSYPRMMDRILAQTAALPGQQLAEISFPALLRDPVAAIKDLYARLDLGDVAPLRAALPERGRPQIRPPQPAEASDLNFAARYSELVAPYRQRLGYAQSANTVVAACISEKQ